MRSCWLQIRDVWPQRVLFYWWNDSFSWHCLSWQDCGSFCPHAVTCDGTHTHTHTHVCVHVCFSVCEKHWIYMKSTLLTKPNPKLKRRINVYILPHNCVIHIKSSVDSSAEDESQWLCPSYDFSSNFIQYFIVGLISMSHSYIFRIRLGKKQKCIMSNYIGSSSQKSKTHTFSPHRYVVYWQRGRAQTKTGGIVPTCIEKMFVHIQMKRNLIMFHLYKLKGSSSAPN